MMAATQQDDGRQSPAVLRAQAAEIGRLWRCGCLTCGGRARWLVTVASDDLKAILRSDAPAMMAQLAQEKR